MFATVVIGEVKGALCFHKIRDEETYKGKVDIKSLGNQD